jgi:hypothetical protein
MTLSLLFWLLMLLWLIFGAFPLVRGDVPGEPAKRSWSGMGGALLPFLAVAVLGWHVFGPAIQG